MKISLLYKPSIVKVCSVLLIAFIVSGTPTVASANWLTDFFGGEQVLASDVDIDNNEKGQNLQKMDLYNSDSSMNPDRNEISEFEDILIVQEDSFVSNEGMYTTDAKFEKSSVSEQISIYTVEKSDTLSEIAEKFNVSTNTIRWENDISGQTIKEGQKLSILPVTGVKHIVKSGDTLSKIVDMYDADATDTETYNGYEKGDMLKKGDIVFVPNGIIKPIVVKSTTKPTTVKITTTSNTKAQSGYYMRPVDGVMTSKFGSRRGGFHYGLDFRASRGTPVVAAASGVVVKAVSNCIEGKKSCGGRYGNYVVIMHSNGTKTLYAHLSKTSVNVGETISQGERIGLTGNTGGSSGPHLHLEIENANGSKMAPPFQ